MGPPQVLLLLLLLLRGCHQLLGLQVVLVWRVLQLAHPWLVTLLLVLVAGLLM